jgi:hypothetical protein
MLIHKVPCPPTFIKCVVIERDFGGVADISHIRQWIKVMLVSDLPCVTCITLMAESIPRLV